MTLLGVRRLNLRAFKSNILAAILLSSCGQVESKGFLSDGNLCNPDFPAGEAAETISGESPFDISGTRTNGQATVAQRMEPATRNTDVWGMQIRIAKKGAPTGNLTVELWEQVKDGDLLFDSGSKRQSPDGTYALQVGSLTTKPEDVTSDVATWLTLEFKEVFTRLSFYSQWLYFVPPYSNTDTSIFTLGKVQGTYLYKYNFDIPTWDALADSRVQVRWIPCK